MKVINFIKKHSYLYKTFSRVIALYVNKGEYNHHFTFEDFQKKVLPKIYESLIIAFIFILLSIFFDSKVDAEKVISFGLSFYGSILGFGMAAYTILLMMSDEILAFLNDKNKEHGLTANILNSDLAFPILMMGLIVFLLFFLLSLGNNKITLFLTSSLFIYGLLLVLEIIRIIYLSMGLLIKRKIENNQNTNIDS